MKIQIQPRAAIPPVFRFTLAAFAAMSMTSQAALLVSESFSNYTDGGLSGQAASGLGLAGNWSSTTTPFERQSAGLAMSGTYSSAGSMVLRGSGTTTHKITADFANALPTGQLYGSYLFSTTTQTDSRSVGLTAVGNATDGDNTASFVWAGNGYYSPTTGNPALEGPGIRAEGTGWVAPSATLNGGETYLMVFTFDGATGTTTAWVLNQSQLTQHLSGSFDSVALNLANIGTEAAGVVWKGSATGPAAGAMTNLHMIGLPRTAGFEFVWDEFRVSDSSLLEVVTVPEPSMLALGLMPGAFGLRRRRA
jgi:hypothetical protein